MPEQKEHDKSGRWEDRMGRQERLDQEQKLNMHWAWENSVPLSQPRGVIFEVIEHYKFFLMFNFQQHTRQLLFDDECKKIKNEHIRLTDLRKRKQFINVDNNLKMSTNYARRVDAFILSALESPVPVDEYRPPNYLPRDILKNSSLACLHPKPFRMKYNTAS